MIMQDASNLTIDLLVLIGLFVLIKGEVYLILEIAIEWMVALSLHPFDEGNQEELQDEEDNEEDEKYVWWGVWVMFGGYDIDKEGKRQWEVSSYEEEYGVPSDFMAVNGQPKAKVANEQVSGQYYMAEYASNKLSCCEYLIQRYDVDYHRNYEGHFE